jgi:hypothetical protein
MSHCSSTGRSRNGNHRCNILGVYVVRPAFYTIYVFGVQIDADFRIKTSSEETPRAAFCWIDQTVIMNVLEVIADKISNPLGPGMGL